MSSSSSSSSSSIKGNTTGRASGAGAGASAAADNDGTATTTTTATTAATYSRSGRRIQGNKQYHDGSSSEAPVVRGNSTRAPPVAPDTGNSSSLTTSNNKLTTGQHRRGGDHHQQPQPQVPKTRVRPCGKCTNCQAQDCGQCFTCQDKRKFGGPGRMHQACLHRKCLYVQQVQTQTQHQSHHRRRRGQGGRGESGNERGGATKTTTTKMEVQQHASSRKRKASAPSSLEQRQPSRKQQKQQQQQQPAPRKRPPSTAASASAAPPAAPVSRYTTGRKREKTTTYTNTEMITGSRPYSSASGAAAAAQQQQSHRRGSTTGNRSNTATSSNNNNTSNSSSSSSSSSTNRNSGGETATAASSVSATMMVAGQQEYDTSLPNLFDSLGFINDYFLFSKANRSSSSSSKRMATLTTTTTTTSDHVVDDAFVSHEDNNAKNDPSASQNEQVVDVDMLQDDEAEENEEKDSPHPVVKGNVSETARTAAAVTADKVLDERLYCEDKKKQNRTDNDRLEFAATEDQQQQKEEEEEEVPPSREYSTSGSSPLEEYYYGKPIPPAPRQGVCAACRKDNNDSDANEAAKKSKKKKKAEPIILCDGVGCGREYHLSCANLQAVPPGDFLCMDCSPTGHNLALLQEYLESIDERRADCHGNSEMLVQALLRQDLQGYSQLYRTQRAKLPKGKQTSSPPSSSSTIASSFNRVPISELERNLCPHVVSLGQYDSRGGGAMSPDALNTTASAAATTTTTTTTTNQHQQQHRRRQPASLIGKPLLLYNPLSNQYHSGRIVHERDYHFYNDRQRKPNSNNGTTTNKSKYLGDQKERGRSSNKDKAMGEETASCCCKQYLVRFPAGKTGGGKVDFHHWIFLEEHAINLGYCLVRAERHRKRGRPRINSDAKALGRSGRGSVVAVGSSGWFPAMAFLRTSRELISILHQLDEDAGHVQFHPPQPTTRINIKVNKKPSMMVDYKNKTSITTTTSATSPSSPSPMSPVASPTVYGSTPPTNGRLSTPSSGVKRALSARSAKSRKKTTNTGTDEYYLFHHQREVADFFDERYYSLEPFRGKGAETRDEDYQIALSQRTMALAEWHEQEAVRQWQRLQPVTNPFHPKALSSLDVHTLGPLLPSTSSDCPPSPLSRVSHNMEVGAAKRKPHQQHAELCPLIRTGLDRTFILEQLEKRHGYLSTASTSSRPSTTINNKDTGVALTCRIVPAIAWGKQQQQQSQRQKKRSLLPS